MRKTAEGLHVSLEISRVFFRSEAIAAAAWRTWIMNDPQAAVAGRSGDADCGAGDPFRSPAQIMCDGPGVSPAGAMPSMSGFSAYDPHPDPPPSGSHLIRDPYPPSP